MNSRDRLRDLVIFIMQSGVIDDIKAIRRDKREPGRRAKTALELRLRRIFLRRFREQRILLLAAIEAYMPERKGIFDVSAWLETIFGPDQPARARQEADLMRLLLAGTMGGVEAFQRNAGLELDYGQINENAQAAVARHVGNMIADIDKTTLDLLRSQVQRFVETPGMTIGDLRATLPFDPRRANSIAVTEVTRAYGEGERMAGEKLAETYPDVKVVKKWYTNEDDKVCPLCGPLGDTDKWIPINKPFAVDNKTGETIMNPPRHVNCRCWIATRTDING